MKTLLKNGMIVDGTGKPGFAGWVVFENGTIQDVLQGGAEGDFDGEILDCTGKVIAPGFIDAHSHNDWFAARKEPLFPISKTFAEQGITTQVTGNCGFSSFWL